ncbi:hypothetical protein LguiB_011110 [Lonicera macranthoides]
MASLNFSPVDKEEKKMEKEEEEEERTLDGSVDRHGKPAVRGRSGNWTAATLLLGLASLSLTSYIFLIKPNGCGSEKTPCGSHSVLEIGMFYVSIYLIALGNGGYQPNIATLGADQFDEDHPKEGYSKLSFFSYFYLALNLGSLFSNTILGYFEDKGMWALGFWASTGSGIVALVLFLIGTPRYRHFTPRGNPLSRFGHVVVAAARKWTVKIPPRGEELYEVDGDESNGGRKILHTRGFKFLDRAAVITSKETYTSKKNEVNDDPWHLCTVTQVEEVKCILRLLPIWLCTILYSVLFTQMASLFVEQGAAMKTTISTFHIPPAGMSIFDILSVAAFIFIYRRVLDPLVAKLKKYPNGLTELQRMGIGLIIAIVAIIIAGIVEHFRYWNIDCVNLTIKLMHLRQSGASEVFMYVGQLEFFNKEAPEGLKSFGSALCMTSISLGNYVSSLLVTIVMKISTKSDKIPGWIPSNLNKGHLDRFYFLLALFTTADFVVYILCAKWYQNIRFVGKVSGGESREKIEHDDSRV